MPEERGLYRAQPLEPTLVFLARLKGLDEATARRRLKPWLERLDLYEHRHKKVQDLSKGMQQKAQIINTILHGPELIIIDEPFAALDPLNTQVVKDLIRELRDQGTTIVMSTHQMHQAEELCDRIVLINEGRDVLYGPLDDIRRRFSGHAVLVRATGELPEVPGVIGTAPNHNGIKLTLAEGTSPQDVLKDLVTRRVDLERFEIAIPTLDEIFIRVVAES